MGDKQVMVVSADDAKARALAVLKAHTEAVSFVRQEDIDTQGMFLPVVSVVPVAQSDMHQLGGGMLMPKSHQVNRMGEAAGVNVTSVDVSHPSQYVWVGKAHGTKRMPDGSMREGEGEYSFDAEIYAELDFAKDGKSAQPKYTSEQARKIHLLEYAKFGHQRASTGARLALIRFFCKCPTAFKAAELPRAMIFARVDLNTDSLLQAPEMRDAAMAHALGATRELFGPGYGNTPEPEVRDVTPTKADAPATQPSPTARTAAPAAELDPFADEAEPEETPEQRARATLTEWSQHDALVKRPKALAAVKAALADESTPLARIEELIGKCRALEGGAA